MEEHPIVLFDGVCKFCNGSVNYIIDHDPNKIFRFAPIQSEFGTKLAKQHGQDPEKLDSVMLVFQGKLYKYSSAGLRIGTRLKGFPKFLAYLGYILPRFVRDAIYKLIAKRRYKWFGKLEACRMPTPDLKERFLG